MCRGLSNATVYGAVFIALRWAYIVNWVTEGFWAANCTTMLRWGLFFEKMRHMSSKLINNNQSNKKDKILFWKDKLKV